MVYSTDRITSSRFMDALLTFFDGRDIFSFPRGDTPAMASFSLVFYLYFPGLSFFFYTYIYLCPTEAKNRVLVTVKKKKKNFQSYFVASKWVRKKNEMFLTERPPHNHNVVNSALALRNKVSNYHTRALRH